MVREEEHKAYEGTAEDDGFSRTGGELNLVLRSQVKHDLQEQELRSGADLDFLCKDHAILRSFWDVIRKNDVCFTVNVSNSVLPWTLKDFHSGYKRAEYGVQATAEVANCVKFHLLSCHCLLTFESNGFTCL